MFYFFNGLMYLTVILFLGLYFRKEINYFSFLIILFNMNLSIIMILKNINVLWEILFSLISIILYYFINLFNKENKEVILINHGIINFNKVINYYNYQKLMCYLKLRKIKLEDVLYCIKSNHRLVVVKK